MSTGKLIVRRQRKTGMDPVILYIFVKERGVTVNLRLNSIFHESGVQSFASQIEFLGLT